MSIFLHDNLMRKKGKDSACLAVEKRGEGKYVLLMGIWIAGGKAKEYSMTREVVMNPDDLMKFAEALEKVLQEKPTELQQLPLTFQQNEPKFQFLIHWMQPSDTFYPSNENTFEAELKFNIHYSVVKSASPDDAYLYEGEGHFITTVNYLSPEDVQKFIHDLRNEAEKNDS